jgi:hypothetical protein
VGGLVLPGSAGPNQIWDFSKATTALGGTFKIVECSSTPCSASFPTSDWCWEIAGTNRQYYTSSSSRLEQLARDIRDSCNGGMNFTPNPKTLAIFPFNYNESFTDTWQTTTGTSGSCSGIYDAYGTLITPFGTYHDVVRVTYSENDLYIKTFFLSSDPVYSILSINLDLNATIITVDNNVAVDGLELDNAISIYPNPCDGIIFMTIPNALTKTDLVIVNMLGEIVYNAEINDVPTGIDLSNKSKGVYVARYNDGIKMHYKKIIRQ